MILVVRIGDGGDYQEVDGISELAECLKESCVDGRLERTGKYRIESDQFRGNDYISLFWGHDVETPISDVTDEEMIELNEAMSKG